MEVKGDRCVFFFFSPLQLLAVFMQMGARELLMHYMDLKQTNDVQLTFEALKVRDLVERQSVSDWLGVTPACLECLARLHSVLLFVALAVPGVPSAAQEVCGRVCCPWGGAEASRDPSAVHGGDGSVSVSLLLGL